MIVETDTVVLRKLIPSEGMVITDIKTETLRSEVLYLGSEDDPSNYKEIDKNTPIPQLETE